MYNERKVKEIYLFNSLKGGCGKTTISTSFACYLAEEVKAKTAILDMDITSPSVGKVLGLQGREVKVKKGGLIEPVYHSDNLKVMTVDFFLPDNDQPILFEERKKVSLIEQVLFSTDFGDVDYLVIDTPPSTSKELVAILKLFPKDKLNIVFVTQPSPVSINSVIKSIRYLKEKGYYIKGVVSNMDGYVCPKCGHYDPLFVQDVSVKDSIEKYGISFLGKVPMGIMDGKNDYVIRHEKFYTVAETILTTKARKFKEKKFEYNIFKKLYHGFKFMKG